MSEGPEGSLSENSANAWYERRFEGTGATASSGGLARPPSQLWHSGDLSPKFEARFSQFALSNTKEPICRLTRLLDRSLYSGDWDYGEDEYELYLRRYPEGPPAEDEFRNTVQQVREKWVDVRLLLADVDELVKVLVKTGLEATWWYEPGLTEVDFRALTQTLSLAAERGAERIRINIT
jgi:hypothetical protein